MTAYVVEAIELMISFKAEFSAIMLLLLLLALWVAWLEHVLRRSRQSTAVLSEALQKIVGRKGRGPLHW
jgi:hypothetical protein